MTRPIITIGRLTMLSGHPWGIYVMLNPKPQAGRFAPKTADWEAALVLWPSLAFRVFQGSGHPRFSGVGA